MTNERIAADIVNEWKYQAIGEPDGDVLICRISAALDAKDRDRDGAVGAALAISGDAISKDAKDAAATITAMRAERDGMREALEQIKQVCSIRSDAFGVDVFKIARTALAAGQARDGEEGKG